MSFEVVPADVDAAGQQVKALAGAMPLASTYLDTYMRINGDSKLFGLFKGEIDEKRAVLVDDYDSKAGPIFTSAGGALEQMARDYDGVDRAQAAGYDAAMPDDWEYDRPYGMDSWGETPGVDLAEFTAMLGDPTSSFAEWEEFMAMRKGLDTILGWDWLFDWLGLVGVPNMTDMVTEWLQGDYDSMGRCMGAMAQMSDFWSKVRREMAASMHHVDETWSGNAANATFAWFTDYDNILGEHARDVNGVYTRMHGYAMGLRMVIDSICDALQRLMEFVTGLSGFPHSWADVLEWLLRGAAKMVLKKIFIFIDAILLLLDIGLLIGGLLSMLFSQLAGHGEIAFPDDVPALEPSDVDGP
ncbi:MAG: hypothetical protein ACI379_16940 [Nocardioides sp.]|uniref:hypothetical protein n=1 Tax=Nocardioides sp. TaxID=35761 RepID=UPI003F0778EC